MIIRISRIVLFGLCLIIISKRIIFGQRVPEESVLESIKQLKMSRGLDEGTETDRTAIPKALEEIYTKGISAAERITTIQSVLDKTIDENRYYIGPGDNFIINVWGKTEKTYTLQVDNEGNILIPFYGLININGNTLAEAKKIIKERIFEIYKKPDKVIITLGNIPQFKTYILGEVNNPGGYLVNGVTRVSDIIKMAGGINLLGKKRGIEITNDLYDTCFVDLAGFYHSQDMEGNPYIRQGDKIFVPPRKDFITVYGFVNHPDTFDICVGDTIQNIVKAAGGFSRGADSAKILIHRFLDDYDSLVLYEISYSQARDFQVLKDDRIYVCGIPEYRKHLEVTITGEVNYPGVYPIRKDKTHLSDVIRMAGGLTDDAFLKGSKIIRKFYTDVGSREFERVKSMPLSDLTPLERSYLKTRLVEEEGIVSIDFEELIKSGSELFNIILRNKDEIIIARRSLSVKVSGAVILPGLIGHKEGAGYKYYLEQAGGFHTRARKAAVMIIKGGTEVMLEPRKVDKIEAGDAIWVPEKEYINKFQLTKDILLILGSVATISLSIFTINSITKE